MKSRNSIFSIISIVLSAMVFMLIGIKFWQYGSLMFSPGDLTEISKPGIFLGEMSSHAEFEGQCDLCHKPFGGIDRDFCLVCHFSISDEIALSTGIHTNVRLFGECQRCHPDHQGKGFDPSIAELDFYDHESAKFSLIWHQVDYQAKPLDCSACHMDDYSTVNNVLCIECHGSSNRSFITTHLEDFGDQCTDCHDGIDTISDFDHQETKFPLNGLHSTTACVDCHQAGEFESQDLECFSCHAEPDEHTKLFDTNCIDCHTSEGWSPAAIGEELFNHETQTPFSLVRHQRDYSDQLLVCLDCHTSFEILDVLPQCNQCHQGNSKEFLDEHINQFGESCLICHDGIDRYTDFNHDQIFLLDGEHVDLECGQCHQDQDFIGTANLCIDCHQEPEIHADWFGLKCEYCHTSSGWTPASLISHAFPLDHGDELETTCETCHSERYFEYTCFSCHEHERDETIDDHLRAGISTADVIYCVDCHSQGFVILEND
jgi:hypothetical protein